MSRKSSKKRFIPNFVVRLSETRHKSSHYNSNFFFCFVCSVSQCASMFINNNLLLVNDIIWINNFLWKRRRLHQWQMTNDQQACSVWRRTDERAEHKLFTQINVEARRYSSLRLKGQESLMVIISCDRLFLIDAIAPRWRTVDWDSAFPTQAPSFDITPGETQDPDTIK